MDNNNLGLLLLANVNDDFAEEAHVLKLDDDVPQRNSKDVMHRNLGPKLGPIRRPFSSQNGVKLRQINEYVDGS
jgi:hypothetical protein